MAARRSWPWRDYSGAALRDRARVASQRDRLPVVALLTGTLVWGVIWYPYRVLAEAGIGALSSSLLTYAVAFSLALAFFYRDAWVLPDIELAILAVAAGLTNVGFIWATNHGAILRVLLLFYLMPVWTVVFAYALLRLVPSWQTLLWLLVALCGAAVMLWQPQRGVPLPANPAEWAGLSAGVAFALSNVLVHRAEQHSARRKSVWILGGCVALAALGALLFEGGPRLGLSAISLFMLGAVGCALFCVNVVVQFGLERLPPNRVPLIYLFELVVAAYSAWFLAGEAVHLKEAVSGVMILAATLSPEGGHAPPSPQAVERADGVAP